MKNYLSSRPNWYKPVMNEFRVEIERSFLNIRGIKFWHDLSKSIWWDYGFMI